MGNRVTKINNINSSDILDYNLPNPPLYNNPTQIEKSEQQTIQQLNVPVIEIPKTFTEIENIDVAEYKNLNIDPRIFNKILRYENGKYKSKERIIDDKIVLTISYSENGDITDIIKYVCICKNIPNKIKLDEYEMKISEFENNKILKNVVYYKNNIMTYHGILLNPQINKNIDIFDKFFIKKYDDNGNLQIVETFDGINKTTTYYYKNNKIKQKTITCVTYNKILENYEYEENGTPIIEMNQEYTKKYKNGILIEELYKKPLL